jgi:transaldolase
MQLFIDSADPKEIREAWGWGIIDGVTTNPSLAAKVGKPYTDIVKEILEVANDGVVNLEVVATDYQGMVDQAETLSKMDERIVVKLPCTQDGIKATAKLAGMGVFVNVTLVFSVTQALLAAKAGAVYVSPFVGRLDDVDPNSGDTLVEDIRTMYDNYDFDTEILYASVRDAKHVADAALIGADVATVPFEILKQLVQHPLTDKGLSKFLEDWNASGLTLPV